MKNARHMLLKTLVQTFYARHAGLLLFVFYVFFGVVNGSNLLHYHISLVRAILDSFMLLGIVVAVWILYAGKALVFVRSQLMKEEMNFLLLFENFSLRKKRTELVFIQFLMMIPVLLYGVFMIGVALNDGKNVQALIVLYFLFMLLAVPAYLTELFFNRTQRGFEWLYWRWRFIEKMEFVYVRYIFGDLNFGLAISKGLSLLLMFGLLTGFGIDNYDLRLPLLAMLVSAATHSMIVFNVQQFEVHDLEFVKQLPVSFFRRILPLIGTYFFMLLPEFIVIIQVYLLPGHLQDLPVILLFGTLWLTAVHAFCYFNDIDKERFPLIITAFLGLCFFLLLFNLQWYMIALFCGLIVIGMNRWYFLFEKRFD